ncbi:MAG TPA: ChbG/HpnK family deacetylase [Anaerolineaceae bacterium]|nr:ChbG/HpnK family deacetylase [Anaerolineaceae bacterium]
MDIKTRSLIINADDFGYNEAITQGILKGYREGLITTTSAMVNLPGAPERIAAARARNPTLPIGLHLNLTAGRPVLQAERVPHLVRPDGTFLPYEAIFPRLSEIPIDEVRAEISAQAQILINCGVVFDHIDYHQHIMAMVLPLFEVVAELAEEYNVPVRQPVLKIVPGRFKVGGIDNLGIMLREIGGAFVRKPHRMTRFLSQIFAYRRLRNDAARLGAPDWFIGAFFNDPTLANFSAILRQLPSGLSEIMVHPALEHEELYTMDEGYRAERPRELAVLLDRRARAEVDRLGIRLTDFTSARRQGESKG